MRYVITFFTTIVLLAIFTFSSYAWPQRRQKALSQDQVEAQLKRFDYSMTTSQDNNIAAILNGLTPQMFGAKGDGRSDDTDALRKAVFESDRQGKVLVFPNGYNYRISGALNYNDGKYRDITLNMLGAIPVKRGTYVPSEYGGVSVDEGVSVFKNATIRGSIKSMCFTGKRRDDVRFFDTCICSGLVVTESNFAEFGAFFYDTSINKVTQVTCNTFLTVFYFARNEKRSTGMTDSTISFNYINGGKEKNDNACFEWGYFNGSLVTNNFIDYYRTIYYPFATSKQIFVSPVSSNNHYQVFRYFYAPREMIHNIFFYSYGDAFNWMDPSTDETLEKYKPFTYKGEDGIIYDIPPYIARCGGPWRITIKGAKIEQFMKTLVFVGGTVTEYQDATFDVEFCGNDSYAEGQIEYKQGSRTPIYNGGKYKNNRMNITGIIENVDELPSLNVGWSTSVNGRRVKYNGDIYKATNIQEGGTWHSVWLKE